LTITRKIKVSELAEFDATEYQNSEEDVAAYLTSVLEESDPALLAAALGDIARARGMSLVAKEAGIAREVLYKALHPESEPRFETISRVCIALACVWWRSHFIRPNDCSRAVVARVATFGRELWLRPTHYKILGWRRCNRWRLEATILPSLWHMHENPTTELPNAISSKNHLTGRH